MNITLENGKVILSEEDFIKLLEGKSNNLVVNPTVYSKLDSSTNCHTASKSLEQKVTEYLLKKGIRRHLSGFDYLRKAIITAIKRPEALVKITVLYITVARACNSTGSKIERAIRHSIESTGNKVVNSQFICDAVDEIKLMGGDIE